jgi:hypothetical protein
MCSGGFALKDRRMLLLSRTTSRKMCIQLEIQTWEGRIERGMRLSTKLRISIQADVTPMVTRRTTRNHNRWPIVRYSTCATCEWFGARCLTNEGTGSRVEFFHNHDYVIYTPSLFYTSSQLAIITSHGTSACMTNQELEAWDGSRRRLLLFSITTWTLALSGIPPLSSLRGNGLT